MYPYECCSLYTNEILFLCIHRNITITHTDTSYLVSYYMKMPQSAEACCIG